MSATVVGTPWTADLDWELTHCPCVRLTCVAPADSVTTGLMEISGATCGHSRKWAGVDLGRITTAERKYATELSLRIWFGARYFGALAL